MPVSALTTMPWVTNSTRVSAVEPCQIGLERLHLGVPVLAAADQVAERREEARPRSPMASCAVSLHRHQGLDSTRSNVTPMLAEGLAGARGVGAALLAQVALGGAILELETRRIAVAAKARRVRVAHEGHMPRLAQQRPGVGLGVR